MILMSPMKKIIAIILVTILFFNICTIVRTEAQPSWIPERSEIRSSKVVIQLHNLQPEYLIYLPESTEEFYSVKFVRLIEFIDTNGDGLFDYSDRQLAIGILCEKTQWHVDVRRNTTTLVVNLTARIRVVHLYGRYGPPSSARVSMVNWIFSNDMQLNDYDIRGGSEIKIDLIVKNWPWHLKTSMLALQIEIRAFRGSEKPSHGRMHVRDEHDTHKQKNMKEIGYISESIGYGILFRASKKILVDDEETTLMGITASNDTILITYPRFSKKLIHDPSIRIIQIIEEKIGFVGELTGLIIGILGITIAYMSIIKFKRKLGLNKD